MPRTSDSGSDMANSLLRVRAKVSRPSSEPPSASLQSAANRAQLRPGPGRRPCDGSRPTRGRSLPRRGPAGRRAWPETGRRRRRGRRWRARGPPRRAQRSRTSAHPVRTWTRSPGARQALDVRHGSTCGPHALPDLKLTPCELGPRSPGARRGPGARRAARLDVQPGRRSRTSAHPVRTWTRSPGARQALDVRRGSDVRT